MRKNQTKILNKKNINKYNFLCEMEIKQFLKPRMK